MMPTLDARILGLARAYLGLVLLFDLARRLPFVGLLYSNEGVLPNHHVLFTSRRLLSVLFACSTPTEAGVVMGLMGVVYVLFTLGLFTRTMQALAVVSLVSLNNRALCLEDGGVVTTLLLLVYTLPLPMGAYLSLDSWRERRERASRRLPWEPPPRKVGSVWALLVIGQLAVIYVFNVASKTGATWHHGEAVHWVLWQSRVATPIAAWLRMHEPSWFSPLASWGTLVVEGALPLLLLSPWRSKEARALGLLLACGLHLGIAALMTLGPFSYAMIGFWLVVQQGELLDDVLRRVKRSTWNIGLTGGPTPQPPPPAPQGVGESEDEEDEAPGRLGVWGVVREVAGWGMVVAVACQVSVDNAAVPRWLRVAPPGMLGALIAYPRLWQGWRMFAPEAPRQDGTLVIDATTADGRHIDPLTGLPPRMQGLSDAGLATQSAVVSDYMIAVSQPGQEGMQQQLRSYLDRWHTLGGRTSADRLVRYEVWWIANESPPPGSTTPGAVERRRVLGK